MTVSSTLAFLWERPEISLLLSALAAVLLAALAARLVLSTLKRLARGPFSSRLVADLRAPLRLLVPLLALQTVFNNADPDIVFLSGIMHLLALGIIATFVWLGIRAVGTLETFILIKNPVDVSNNLRARRIHTQTKVLLRSLQVLVIILGAAGMLMTFPSVKQFGASLMASAGVAGLAVGFAAKPVLGNLIAGLQIAITQPIRLDDVVIMENEWGRIEEITGTYVVVRIWDNRRLIMPLQWIIENPFQNWTRRTSELLGSAMIWVDYSVPVEVLREEAQRLCKEVPELWLGEVCVVQVIDCNERAMQVRILVDAADSGKAWDLRCYLRENMLRFVQQNYPHALPRFRGEVQTESLPPHNVRHPEMQQQDADRQPGF